MANPIVRHGTPCDPQFPASKPLGEANTACAMSPSIPSQLLSTKSPSGRSSAPGYVVATKSLQSPLLGENPSPSTSAKLSVTSKATLVALVSDPLVATRV
ncbi:MAG TPA: hypothetical protein PK788_04605, partial [Gemmatimonadaceae bacterium]|nr:hypothetical protein [Gemmatimonadaceae bacterium]